MTIYHKYQIRTVRGVFAIQNRNSTCHIFHTFLTNHGCTQKFGISSQYFAKKYED